MQLLAVKLFINLWSFVDYFTFFLYPSSFFTLVCIIIIDKFLVSSQKFSFRYAFSDNFTFIILFFSLMVSHFKNAKDSVGVPRWVPRLLTWWSYARDKLGSQEELNSEPVICKPIIMVQTLQWLLYSDPNSSCADSHHIHRTC